MKDNINGCGCSTCLAGEEKYEFFNGGRNRGDFVQYDYRDVDGELFSCVAKSLELARVKRDLWKKNKGDKDG